MTRIGILEGSLRKASLSRAVARSVAGFVPENMSAAIMPNPGTVPLFNQDVLDEGVPDSVKALAEAVNAVDAVLFVTPEYNWSVPGSLKNAIDWLSRLNPNPLAGKPAAVWSLSPGLLGGARVHEGLRHILLSQDMVVMAKPEVQIAGAARKVDVGEGRISDPDTEAFLKSHLMAFSRFCAAWRP